MSTLNFESIDKKQRYFNMIFCIILINNYFIDNIVIYFNKKECKWS